MSNKKIVKVELNGGLGNQLFQWASGISLATKTNSSCELYTHKLINRKYEIPSELTEKIWEDTKIIQSKKIVEIINNRFPRTAKLYPLIWSGKESYFKEKNYEYSPIVFKGNKIYLSGYYQSWKYFEDLIPKIRGEIQSLTSSNQDFIKLSENLDRTPWIAVHVRRGDYLAHSEIYTLPTKDYYEKAIKQGLDRWPDAKIVVFTDSPDMVDEIVPEKSMVISNKTTLSAAENLLLMSRANALVGANSTLSWWSAFAMQDTAKIVFPTKWFNNQTNTKDLLMPNWETL